MYMYMYMHVCIYCYLQNTLFLVPFFHEEMALLTTLFTSVNSLFDTNHLLLQKFFIKLSAQS